ncbi:hypothetical protein PC116_g29846 [Phytophthora cactorum]|uniref:Uncharacterized protein n=1 Tax=Phytophthora cactorum TaxID=29920 RepID=A0A8T1ANT5_9STRA|nr:hypothetical protein Pcac1_g9870 [Phytophthora cactorum]KAG2793505.1 hypothetical protein PC112_g23416 [Phytophthora cactorum]KAG2872970.1 hypothetical protein PC114_g26090 [Phytophthora cactorum]KAG2877950.1 hypothetical protein PC115_g23210 [Phytophthora cactorum]KAG2883868.1 hypothetical protein PC117_g25930 [Phytophthora cactorum]
MAKIWKTGVTRELVLRDTPSSASRSARKRKPRAAATIRAKKKARADQRADRTASTAKDIVMRRGDTASRSME